MGHRSILHRAVWFEKVVFAQWAVYYLTLSERLQKVAVNGELTCFFVFFCLEIIRFRPEKPFEFWRRPFFLEITCFWPEKPFQSNSRLMKIWVKFVYWCFKLPKKSPLPLRNPSYATAQDSGKLQLSITLRVGPWKIFKMKMGHG